MSLSFLITGGGRGIGRGLTRLILTSSSHRVFVIDSNPSELDHTLQLAQSSWAQGSNGRVRGKLVDLSDRTQIKDLVKDVADFFGGRLDVLINNAFPTPHIWADDKAMDDDIPASGTDSILSQWDQKIAVGLTAPFYLSRLCVPLLTSTSSEASNPGTIIHISSTRAHQSEPNHEAYSAAKAGLLGLTQSMAVSLGAKHRIRVNAITPGWICVDDENKAGDERKARGEQSLEESLSEADHRWHPAGRVGKVEDVWKAVTFLTESDFVSGEEIVLDGGVSKKMVYPE